ncbi:MAG: fibronectin type III domain-containing protein [Gammaproteobacteria bacterium]|nr:fibronectin type III domain-containing protein [Gammaproteobacteria bacterium]
MTRSTSRALPWLLAFTITVAALCAPGVRGQSLVPTASFPKHATPLAHARPAGVLQATTPRALPPAGGTWQAVATAPVVGLCNPLLLTDGTVMIHECNTPAWYKLTPSNSGSYVSGTWSQLASLPVISGSQYAPQYHASAVLNDGRVIIQGGEYNGTGAGVWTNLGAIYDPVANSWTAVTAPAGWTQIGDAASVVLTNGTLMLSACCLNPDVDALFNAATLGWTSTGAPNAGANYQDEQGYELLPSGNVLSIDIWTNSPNGNATNAEQYVASSATWISAGNTPVSLVDPYQCGNWEIGPAVLRPDGSLVAFGGNSGCSALVTALGAAAAVDPTAIYDYLSNTWTAGPNVPAVCTATTNFPTANCTLADAPAAILPNGNILFAASAGYGQMPTHFFEFTSTNAIQQVADPLFFASSSSSFYYNFLVLPNGQILVTDFSNTPEVYTPSGSPNASWAPVVLAAFAPSSVNPGLTYSLSGNQFSGLSQGAYYGDDAQGSTDYPIVQLTNLSTLHVFYAKTSGFDNNGSCYLAANAGCFTYFTVPAGIETGASDLVVIANGIASNTISVNVSTGPVPPAAPTGVTATGGADQVILHWTASAGATSYKVYEGTTSHGESMTPVATGVAGTSITISGLQPGTRYYFYIVAVSAAGSGGGSQEVSSSVFSATNVPLPFWAVGTLAAALVAIGLGMTSRRVRQAACTGQPH